ncbi:cell division ATP-binding protein FtsE [Candidatus Giovannonibacteria bacterium RIFCSPHIGHO2_01_FULL_48_47]|nr:MAG: cell division ATP-binding protein FtsE [Candidatus Giovannonibacteria bacterium RIFCSPHIGHO2_01_FULL_48_47]OGF68632.1 MAG: cell division ATP-binding protein FtsE [Candidatus Giovannonibacteria bacterium RIFCSPHIGHO2_02_FULL_48_15]OGF88168.1 MAG: cell division ATP-binding protein FtsE [Candidatus Giovannonibacteria bacterium RIFCSPLOWO2_01_FULL_48_47]OGF95909.1 MAG: cell division ATP-binding protein FtsE [Candidatus Giovannonibacteria bacterium RIFOXYD1_FULL_48_21]HBT81587.1 cell divisio
MIYFDHVSKVYSPTSAALEDVSFAVEPQEFVSIVGQSGAGKSTLLKLLLAEEKPSSGKVFFESLDVHKISNGELPRVRRRMGVVFQDYKLLPTKTAYENIAFAMEAAGKTEEEIQQDVPQVLELVGLMDKAWHFPSELSGGELQRVAIARAIVNRPDVVIADEPTGNLDPINTWEIINLLEKINELGTTVILATHDKEVINSLKRRVVTLEKGRVVRDEKRGRYVL